jgi:hypothetical protein
MCTSNCFFATLMACRARHEVLHDGHVMRPEDRRGATVPRGLEKLLTLRRVLQVHVALCRIRHMRRFQVRALYQPDHRIQVQEAFDVLRRSPEVRLDRYPDGRVLRLQLAIQRQRAIDVARILHVDPELALRCDGFPR